MRIYLGIVGSEVVKKMKVVFDCGWCLTPDNFRPNEGPYFLDNGAYSAWKNGVDWNETKFKILVNRYPNYDFVVAPDIVCGGYQSLQHSLCYADEIPGPLYLAVQDGMQGDVIRKYLDRFDGIFVGGSIPWKYRTMKMWVDIAHLHGLRCHVGRIGTYEGFIQAYFSGVDSVDSTTPSRNQDDYHIRKFWEHLSYQKTLMGVV